MSGTVTGRWSNRRPNMKELEPRLQLPKSSPFFNMDFSAIEERVMAHLNKEKDTMTPDQAAAFIQSQTVCATAEIAAMHAENRQRELNGHTHAHDDASFREVPVQFGITYNEVVSVFRDANY
jgi:DNA polymerase I-like protein with 3'-5' exonuclease and polymerase domains